MKLNLTILWIGYNLSYRYQQAACWKQHGGHTALVVIVVVVVVAPLAPTSAEPPHTPAEQSPYHSHSFLSKCLPNHKTVTGLRAWLASTAAGTWCTGKHGGPEALIDKDGHDTPETHKCIQTLVHTKSSLSVTGSGIHLQASLLAYCRYLLGVHSW